MKRENEHVYYQRPPQELPALPEGKRMAKATPFVLPPPAPLLTDFGTLDVFKSGMLVRELPVWACYCLALNPPFTFVVVVGTMAAYLDT